MKRNLLSLIGKSSTRARSCMTLLIMLAMTTVVCAGTANAMSLTGNGEASMSTQPEDVFIIGEINGKNWVTNDGVQMTRGEDGLYTATITIDPGMYHCFALTRKLSEDENDWNTINSNRFGVLANGGGADNNFEVTNEILGDELTLSNDDYYSSFQIQEGVYTLTINLEEMTLIIEKIVEPNDVFILGTVNENQWSTNVGVPMTCGEDGLFTARITAKAGDYRYFSFTKKLSENADDWDFIQPYRFGAVSNGDFLVTDELLGQEIALTYENGQALRVESGVYDLILDLEHMTLIINKIKDVFILGDINENYWAADVGVQMTRSEDGIYTATITAKDGGDHYFGFTEKLSENDYDWDSISRYRFGAVSEGDFWVTDEQLGNEITLTYDGGPAFRVSPGVYQLTLDLANMKLIITKVPSITTGLENGQRDSVKGQRDGWFTIDGRKLGGKPHNRGLYIYNGKKAIVN